jgi:hypothetical protein
MQSEGSSLKIVGCRDGVAEDVAAALLGEPVGPAGRSIDRWPPASTVYWGVSTLALACFAVAIAGARITSGWLALTAIGATVAAGFAVIMARRGGASMLKTALGMSPSIIVFGFAIYYGSLMGGNNPSVTVAVSKVPHLVDAFLLSVGMASTGGFFDLGLHTTVVRVVAFAEMLLMVTVAGSSLYVGAHAVWERLGDIVSTNIQG